MPLLEAFPLVLPPEEGLFVLAPSAPPGGKEATELELPPFTTVFPLPPPENDPPDPGLALEDSPVLAEEAPPADVFVGNT